MSPIQFLDKTEKKMLHGIPSMTGFCHNYSLVSRVHPRLKFRMYAITLDKVVFFDWFNSIEELTQNAEKYLNELPDYGCLLVDVLIKPEV